MKRSDLKTGVLYAVRGNYWQPYVLLSTDVHERLVPSRGGVSYKAAPGEKPRRDSRDWGDRRDYGFLAIHGTPEDLAAIDLDAHLAAIVDGTLDPDSLPDSIGLRLITSLTQIEREAALAERKAASRANADVWNAARAVLNPLHGNGRAE